MIKKISFVVFVLIQISLFSQEVNLDKYKYIIVAEKFDFLKKVDQYQTSSLTKFLLQKTGFEVYLNSEKYPKEINTNRCATLFARVSDDSSMFTTKCKIVLEDCYGELVYQSEIGKSKLKEYKKAYHEAIRNAYETMEGFEFSYKPSSVEKKNTISKIKKVTPQTPVVTTVKNKVQQASVKQNNKIYILYAQVIDKGFQLVNTKPEVVFKVFKTNLNDVFLIESKKGIFYKVGEKWIAEYYENNQLNQDIYEVKF